MHKLEPNPPQFRYHTHLCPDCNQEWEDWNPECSLLSKALCEECADERN
jgi:hypothetical protein